MKRMIGGLLLVGLVLMSSPAAAGDKPWSFSLGGGVAMPVGGAGDSLGSGGQVTLGFGYRVRPQIEVFGEYNFSSLGDKELTLPQPLIIGAQDFSGNGWFQYGGGGVTFTPWQSAKSSVYVLGGAGVYYRSVSLPFVFSAGNESSQAKVRTFSISFMTSMGVTGFARIGCP